MLVVDSSVLVDFLRGGSNDHTAYLAMLEEQGTPYGIPGICVQEVLQGARDEREWKVLKSYLLSQSIIVPLDAQRTHLEAARIYYDCRKRGLTIRSTTDCFIAQLCLETKGELLHSDRDFELISKVRSLKFPKL